MHLDFYNLNGDPFQNTQDPEAFFLSTSHLEALAAITFGIVHRKGFLVVLGETGLGKTTLIRALFNDPDQKNLKIIPLLDSNVPFGLLLQAICQGLGFPVETDERSGLLNQLYQALQQEHENGNNVVFLIDEAQNMPEETLENLRMISNLETPSEKIIQVVLFGQPVLWEILGRYELRQLKQRIVARINLSPLSKNESLDYIKFRIARAGGQTKSIFTRGALEKIILQAEGFPEKINTLGTLALKAGYRDFQKPISKKVVRQAMGDFKETRSWRIRRWASTLMALLLIAGGLFGLTTHFDFYSIPLKLPSTFRHYLGQSAEIATNRVITKEGTPSVPAVNPPTVSSELLSKPSTPEGVLPDPKAAPTPLPTLSETGRLPGLPELKEITGAEKKTQSPQRKMAKKKGELKKKKGGGVTKTVKKGDSFIRLVMEVYGTSDQTLCVYVQKHNPRIKDFHNIRAGEKIFFPEWKN